MSEHQPPSGTPEYLEQGGGAPLLPPETAPAEPGAGRGRGRRAWWIGGGVLALVGLGAGAWAALGFFQQGTQPAAALPASTMAYLSIDLDPSGGQKIDAFRTLNKFPAFKDEVGVSTVDDIRRKVGEAFISSAHCTGLTYADDVEPWLGDRAAVAAVDLGQDDPAPVFVLQVTDEGKARQGIEALNACDGPDDSAGDGTAGYVVQDGWALLADTQQVADQVAAETKKGTLADDATYQRWTQAVGDAGVVNGYAAPAVGPYLNSKVGDLEQQLQQFGQFGLAAQTPGTMPGTTPGAVPSPVPGADPSTVPSADSTTVTSAYHAAATTGPLNDALQHFQGAAMTLRFTGDGLELATASDPGLSQSGMTSDQGGRIVSRLPDDTAAALGVGLRPGWFTQLTDRMRMTFGGGLSRQQLEQEMSADLGIDVPADLETLLGTSTALSLDGGFSAEDLANAADLSKIPVAATVQGDPAAIGTVLDKLRGQSQDAAQMLGSDSSDDLVAIGPSAAYRQKVLTGGHLGETDAFRSVVPDADRAGAVLFVNADAMEVGLGDLIDGDAQTAENINPLKAIGFSTWLDGDVAHASFRITTD
jgi:hypothetical protein